MITKRKTARNFLPLLTALLLLCALTACGQDKKPSFDCPFTELNWDSTTEDMTAAEGENYSTYDSLYGGLCYTIRKSMKAIPEP